MKKSDYMKYAWNKADDIALECSTDNYIKFKYALGVKVGLSIAMKIMKNGWTEEEINSYLDRIFNP